MDDHTLRVVAARIAERAGEYGLAVKSGSAVNLRPFHCTSTYPLYLAQIHSGTGKPQRVVVKFAPVYGQHREGEAEYANLRAMAERLGSTGPLHVPRPLDYWEDVNALLTEYRPGPRFSQRILSAPRWFMAERNRGVLSRTACQCGEWLRIYHDATSRGEGPAIDDRFIKTIQRDLGQIPERGALHSLRGPLEQAFAVVMDRLAERRVAVAVRHGDFSPDNVHLDGDGICVFDLSHHLPAAVDDDITFFLVTLATINPYPRHWTFDRRIARALESPFLDGYFGDERGRREARDSEILGAYMLKNLLTRCLRQRRVAAARGAIALAMFDRLLVAGHFRDLLTRAMERVTDRS